VNLVSVIFTALAVAMAMGAVLGSRIPLGSQSVDGVDVGETFSLPRRDEPGVSPDAPATPEAQIPTVDRATSPESPTPASGEANASATATPQPPSASSQATTGEMSQATQPESTATVSSGVPTQPRQTSGQAIPALW
jgi:hypothetical protein